MSLHAKLQLYLDGKAVSWTNEGARELAAWSEPDGARLLVAVPGALTADALVDAHLRALPTQARLTVVHEGAPTAVAQRTAARFGITLLDAGTLPAPAPVLALPPPEPEPLLPAHVADDIMPWAAPAPSLAPMAPPAPMLVPEPVLADDPMPWGAPVELLEPAPTHVEPIELLAMPWHTHPHVPHDEHLEITSSPRTQRRFADRPTQLPAWSLPGQKPGTAPLAIHDPRIWRNEERLHLVHQRLEQTGAPSFGAIKKP